MLFNIERQQEILNLLKKYRSISVQKLSKLLYVSAPTIRRDLSALERQGKVHRTHGGVILRRAAESEIPLIYRQEQNSRSKELIAEKAAQHISDGNVIFLDASSTAAHIIPHLTKFKDIIAITNGPKTALKLGECGIKTYCTGGLLLAHSIAYVGSEAEQFIGRINADLFFFSSRGYTENENVTDSSAEEAAIKRAMLRQSDRAFYLCDSSKKDQKYMYNVCSFKELNGVITETED